jgi:hypothetical protein
MATSKLDTSLFCNVDLDIYSKSDLQPLVSAFGDKIIDLYVRRVRRAYEVHLELGAWKRNQTPSWVILGFCKLIKELPPEKRRIWNAAKTKSFDIGIAAPTKGSHYWSAVGAAADVGAQIAITVYAPMKVSSKPKKKAP